MDLQGKRFGKWTVLRKSNNKKRYWYCRCDCGTEKDVAQSSLRMGQSKCCGCSKVNSTYVVGEVFGRLTVISQKGKLCHCKCSCGNEVDFTVRELTNGRKRSCGCAKHENEDLSGQRFTKLVALYKVYRHNDVGYVCRCDCGNEIWFEAYKLRGNIAKSCGCLRHEISNDLTGRVFGMLTVIEFSHRENSNVVWKCQCECGGTKLVSANQLLKGNVKSCGCLSTGRYGSTEEREVKDFIELISNKEFVRDRSILDGKEIDMYNDELKLGIEYNGSVYHASNGGVYDDKPVKYHFNKYKLAREHGVHLVTIFDVDWKENKDKIKNYLISLVCSKKFIYARNCIVKDISINEARKFCESYHLQGWNSLGKINIGLYYADELISLMSFGSQRLKKRLDGYYDIHRYCIKDGYSIIGGAQKIYKYFERNYFPIYVRSYSDNNYFTGNVYEKLGFSEKKSFTPSYYWFFHNTKIKREDCQPKRLKKLCPDLYDKVEGGKEVGIMLALGACRVYTCGNTLWEKRYG